MAWWRDAVIYQVYVRSFADSDGDGVGDLPGIVGRLPYIQRLGVDAIWLNPFYPSPQADGGYDVSDYRNVEPRFGTLDDFDRLVAEAHRLGLRVIVDIVPNHTSSAHVWFQEALRAEPGSPARARYIFREGRGDGGEPPNNWSSLFGGPAWTRVTKPDGEPGQWYLHLFDTSQPDLDWSNPEVGDEFESTLRFWLDRGADGFRIDVANALAKHAELPDLDDRFMHRLTEEGHPHWDRDEVHEVYRRWRLVADEYDGDRAFVAEAWLRDPERLARYLRPDELHTAFNFHFLLARWDASSVRKAVDSTLDAVSSVGAPATWVLSNHDVTRHVTRYGGGRVGERRARAAALLMLALPGSAYIYQGEELGLPEVEDLPDELRQDPTFRRTRGEIKGRDGCRVPIPWSGDEPPFDFTTAAAAWLPQPSAWAKLTAAREQDQPGSMHSLYREALALRRTLEVDPERIEWVEADGDVLVFRRAPNFACAVNFGNDVAELPPSLSGASVLLASTRARKRGTLGANSTAWLSVGRDPAT